MRTIRIALVQTNPLVGDLAGNRDRIIDAIGQAKKLDADIVAFPELAVTGYPPEDLLLKPQFVKDNLRTLKEIGKATTGITAIVGFVDTDKHIYNAAAVLDSGKHVYTYHKILLPNYGVFDEYRYFKPGTRYPVLLVNDAAVGISICEDIWFDHGPTGVQARAGAEVVININASPYHKGRGNERLQMLTDRARENKVNITYTNMVGGQDELVFDGHSLVIDKKGVLIAAGSQFEEDLIAVDIPVSGQPHIVPLKERGKILGSRPGSIDYVTLAKKATGKKPLLPLRKPEKPLMVCEEVHNALVLGTRDYLYKNGFTTAVIGLSGGIDSSVVAAVAVEALGSKQVTGVFMPSPYSSKESEEDAYALAENLGITILTIPIDQPFDGFLNALRPVFAETATDVTEENLQARTRGNILMALSNKFGWIVLTTGNKSEMSVGYATLYGDMAGGFAVIKDVPKTMVYEVAECCNRIAGRIVIPKRVMTKAPTAELRPDQKDTDALPPYEELDPILKAYVEDDRTFDEILAMGFDRKTVERVIRLVDKSEYKRRQAPPGIKITPRALGRDRRFPITNRYKSY
ncbi:MAG TPA: NAD+ synthase [Nitrospiraceae bacterium]|nr:NAD+ synthase [Nitrospiraceae bacterium]